MALIPSRVGQQRRRRRALGQQRRGHAVATGDVVQRLGVAALRPTSACAASADLRDDFHNPIVA